MWDLITHLIVIVITIKLSFEVGLIRGSEVMKAHIIDRLAELARPNSEELHNIISECKYKDFKGD